jgi:hypothetical protein
LTERTTPLVSERTAHHETSISHRGLTLRPCRRSIPLAVAAYHRSHPRLTPDANTLPSTRSRSSTTCTGGPRPQRRGSGGRPKRRGSDTALHAGESRPPSTPGFEAAFHSGEATPPCTPGIRGRPPRLHAGEARPLCTLGKRRCPARRGIGPPSTPAIRGCGPLRGSEAALHAGEATLPCTPGSEANLNAATLTTLALAGHTQLTTSCNPTTSCRTFFRSVVLTLNRDLSSSNGGHESIPYCYLKEQMY